MDQNNQDEDMRVAGFVVMDEPRTGPQRVWDFLRDLWAGRIPANANKFYARILGIAACLGFVWLAFKHVPHIPLWQSGLVGAIIGIVTYWILSKVWWLTNLILLVILLSTVISVSNWYFGPN